MRLAISIAVFLMLLLSPESAESAGAWTFKSGEELPGDPVAFDFGKKTLTVTNPLTGKKTLVPTKNLSLRSRQRLLFSPLFHRGDTGESLWPPEKRRLLLQAIAPPAGILFLGFWVSGWIVAGKFNPFLAVIGFLGAWIIVAIFMVCYAFLQIRFGGGLKTTLVGIGFSLTFTPLFVSAVYTCSYGKAHLVFLFHLLAGLCILSIGMVLVETITGEDRVEAWWNRTVFEPLGLTEPAHDEVLYFLREKNSRAT